MLLVDIMEVPPIELDGIDHVGAKDDENFDEDYYPDVPNDDDEELLSKFKVSCIYLYIDDRSVHMHAVVYTLLT